MMCPCRRVLSSWSSRSRLTSRAGLGSAAGVGEVGEAHFAAGASGSALFGPAAGGDADADGLGADADAPPVEHVQGDRKAAVDLGQDRVGADPAALEQDLHGRGAADADLLLTLADAQAGREYLGQG